MLRKFGYLRNQISNIFEQQQQQKTIRIKKIRFHFECNISHFANVIIINHERMR